MEFSAIPLVCALTVLSGEILHASVYQRLIDRNVDLPESAAACFRFENWKPGTLKPRQVPFRDRNTFSLLGILEVPDRGSPYCGRASISSIKEPAIPELVLKRSD